MSEKESVRDQKPSATTFFWGVSFWRLSLVLVVLMITVSPALSAVTMEQYENVRLGMEYREVVAILGEPDQEVSKVQIGFYESAMYKWNGASPGPNMNVTFENGIVESKGQFGLGRPAKSSVTMKQYEQIRKGMTFSEVEEILGKPAQELSRSKFRDSELVMYMWKGFSPIANMNVTLQDGKVDSKGQFGLK